MIWCNFSAKVLAVECKKVGSSRRRFLKCWAGSWTTSESWSAMTDVIQTRSVGAQSLLTVQVFLDFKDELSLPFSRLWAIRPAFEKIRNDILVRTWRQIYSAH